MSDLFNIRTNGRLSNNDFAQSQFVQDSSFSRIGHAENNNFDLLVSLPRHLLPEFAQHEPH